MQKIPQPVMADNPNPLLLLDQHTRREAAAQDAVADCLAEIVFGRPTLGDLDRQQATDCRYTALLAIRRASGNWHQAALRKASAEAERMLREDCGRAIAALPKAHHEVIAPMLAIRIVHAYLGVLEGTSYQSPGETLAIVTGSEALP